MRKLQDARTQKSTYQNNEDCQKLKKELDFWKTDQVKKIKDEPNQKENFDSLLTKEVELLRKIEELKLQCKRNMKSESSRMFLESLGQPKYWPAKGNQHVFVKTPFTIRAEELNALYSELTDYSLKKEQRLEVLAKINLLLAETPTSELKDHVIEIRSLIDREAEMIARKRPIRTLGGLRLRLSRLFLDLIQNQEVNPEAGRYTTYPVELLNASTR